MNRREIAARLVPAVNAAAAVMILALTWTAPVRAAEGFRLEPVYAQTTNGQQVLVTGADRAPRVGARDRVFFAILTSSSEWPAGLVPLFAVDVGKGFELRRLPAR